MFSRAGKSFRRNLCPPLTGRKISCLVDESAAFRGLLHLKSPQQTLHVLLHSSQPFETCSFAQGAEGNLLIKKAA